MPQHTLLIHGLLGFPATMALLGRRLAAAGVRPSLWGYSSFHSRAEALSEALARRIEAFEAEYPDARLHLVGHSLGAVLTRGALALHRPRHLGRVVMLAPPNAGSHVASRLGNYVRRFCPLVNQLADRDGSWVRALGPLEGVEVGVIAAAKDPVVTPDSTHLPDFGETEHVTCPGRHGLLPLRADVAELTTRFLRCGQFAEPQVEPEPLAG